MLGLKWRDVDWLGNAITIERGVVKQLVADVKTEASGRTMPVADDLLELAQTLEANLAVLRTGGSGSLLPQ